MAHQEKPKGAFILWEWEDQEIDNLKLLRRELLDIHSKGFSGVWISLGSTRYEFIDQKVLRAVAQASQWAKKREMSFWLETDPRQSSRSFISKTGERTENLIVAKKSGDGLNPKSPHIVRIRNNRFELRYAYPKIQHVPMLQERSIYFEPLGLEKVFIFQMQKGGILMDTVRDITSASHFFANIEKNYVDIFGDVHVPKDEEWWVIAFPKFNTNTYDYAGFQSNNLLCLFAEDLFDACTHLDGLAWGKGGAGYIIDMGRFPVSLSLYNSFQAEYGYDLRNVLYGLVLDTDDGSHVHIRVDYHTLLMDTVFGTLRKFHQTVHSFLGDIDIGIHHHFQAPVIPIGNLVRGTIDPWKSLESIGSPIIEIEHIEDLKQNSQSLIPVMIIAKSLGVYSNTERVLCNMECAKYTEKELDHIMNLMTLHSIRLLMDTHGNEIVAHREKRTEKDLQRHVNWDNMKKINHKIGLIRNLTGLKFPEANIALIFPIETIIAMGSQGAEEIIASVNQLITRLVLEGIQLDVIAPALLKECHIFPSGLSIRSRIYESIIFPYPEVIDSEVLDIISIIAKSNIPIIFGGCKPRYTTSGKQIPHIFSLTFDPQNEDLSPLWHQGVKPLFTLPENSLGTMIYRGEDTLFSLCPKQIGGSMEGCVQYQKISFSVPKSDSLVIFRKQKYKNVEQIV